MSNPARVHGAPQQTSAKNIKPPSSGEPVACFHVCLATPDSSSQPETDASVPKFSQSDRSTGCDTARPAREADHSQPLREFRPTGFASAALLGFLEGGRKQKGRGAES